MTHTIKNIALALVATCMLAGAAHAQSTVSRWSSSSSSSWGSSWGTRADGTTYQDRLQQLAKPVVVFHDDPQWSFEQHDERQPEPVIAVWIFPKQRPRRCSPECLQQQLWQPVDREPTTSGWFVRQRD